MKQRAFLLFTSIFLLCLQNGCVTNHRYKAYQDMKDFVLNEDNSGIGYLLFFETNTKNQITYQSAFDIQRDLYYSPRFEGIDIKLFFKRIMLGKIQLSCEDLIDCFALTPAIIEEYQKRSFKDFLKTHTIYVKEYNEYIINPAFSYDEKLSIAYYLYLNNFYTTVDDYTGYFSSKKDSLHPKIEEIEGLEEIEEVLE